MLRFPVRALLAVALVLPACIQDDPTPGVRFLDLTHTTIALGQTVHVTIAVDGTSSAPTVTTLDDAVLGVSRAPGATVGSYDLALSARAAGRTTLVVRVDGATFSQELDVAAATTIDLRPIDRVAGRKGRGLVGWSARTKVASGRGYALLPEVHDAEGRALLTSSELQLVESEQVFWYSDELEPKIVVVDVAAPGELVVDLDAGDLLPPARFTVVGVAPEALVGLSLDVDPAPADAAAPRCVTASGIDEAGDPVLGVAASWQDGEAALGTGDRVCYLPGAGAHTLGATVEGLGEPLTFDVIGVSPRVVTTATLSFDFCLFCP